MTVVMRHHPSLVASVGAGKALTYDEGPDAAEDRAAHVRAASGAAWVGGRLVMVQDDARFFGLWDPQAGTVTALALPPGEGGVRLFGDDRGNKHQKLDLEACVSLRVGGTTQLMAFGSGSAPNRDHVVVWQPDEPARVVDATRFYDALRARTDFAGSELNIEGAAVLGERLLLVQRGNGAPAADLAPINATCEVDLGAWLAFVADPANAPVPVLMNVQDYDLGRSGDWSLSFTDVVVRGEQVLYVAVAEASPDATTDGPVHGVTLGILRGPGAGFYGEVLDASGAPFTHKIEGLAPADSGDLWAVVDADDVAVPSQLLRLHLRGPW